MRLYSAFSWKVAAYRVRLCWPRQGKGEVCCPVTRQSWDLNINFLTVKSLPYNQALRVLFAIVLVCSF